MIPLIQCVVIWGRDKGLENTAGLFLLLLASGRFEGRLLRVCHSLAVMHMAFIFRTQCSLSVSVPGSCAADPKSR